MKVSSQYINSIKIDSQVIDKISVVDNRGKMYTVLSVAPHTVIKPGTSQPVAIRVEKSPSIWDDAKSMQVTFDKGLFDLQEKITLSQKIADFETLKVDGFEY
jgi:hypothetical protein